MNDDDDHHYDDDHINIIPFVVALSEVSNRIQVDFEGKFGAIVRIVVSFLCAEWTACRNEVRILWWPILMVRFVDTEYSVD